MGKQFNLKDERAIQLAHALAARKGKTITATIRELLENEHRQMEDEHQRKMQAIMAAFDDLRAQIPPELLKLSSKEWMDAIYDDDGLPE